MILTYSNPRFKDLILSGQKIHTIREDKGHRWKPGMKIQHWMGNPRNVSKNPHCFAEGVCMAVQEIDILRMDDGSVRIYVYTKGVDSKGRFLSADETIELAKNDGLTIDEFRDWFVPAGTSEFTGHIIHFTDKMY